MGLSLGAQALGKHCLGAPSGEAVLPGSGAQVSTAVVAGAAAPAEAGSFQTSDKTCVSCTGVYSTTEPPGSPTSFFV